MIRQVEAVGLSHNTCTTWNLSCNIRKRVLVRNPQIIRQAMYRSGSARRGFTLLGNPFMPREDLQRQRPNFSNFSNYLKSLAQAADSYGKSFSVCREIS